jgi:hypothetical protein
MGHFDEARRDLEKARVVGDEIGDIWIRAQSYAGLGELACLNGQLDEGLRYFKHMLSFAGGSDSPLPIVMFVLTGIAGVYMKQEKYPAALELVTLVMRYPKNFIAMAEDRAQQMMNELTANLGKKFVESTREHSKSLMLKNVIANLLAEK